MHREGAREVKKEIGSEKREEESKGKERERERE